ncbi:Superoxide dismutase [Mn] [Novipirellula aureliae]|uniref:Superoxide dismutase n=1 Tax=Novipirellula aureliae TaxID=2527966 RepID=A0A5C6E7S8_9BACT|nr:Superoxide dismutase [Mn] [Novipirellula aureliae]
MSKKDIFTQDKATMNNFFTRRGFLATSSAIAASASFGLSTEKTAVGQEALGTSAPFSLPPLPYAYDALNPVIDTETMTIHHTKHHQGYVNKLNAAVESDPTLSKMTLDQLLSNLDQLPESARTSVRNNGGGHANHSLFWTIMKPSADESKPSGALAEAIDSAFGSFDNFKTAFSTAGATQFGSGWAWLAKDGEGLKVLSTPNQDSPLSMGMTPLLGLDVWEHAYYLKYQNRRTEYIEAFWKLVNWDQVAAYMNKA